jgi:hypothetical protein
MGAEVSGLSAADVSARPADRGIYSRQYTEKKEKRRRASLILIFFSQGMENYAINKKSLDFPFWVGLYSLYRVRKLPMRNFEKR